MSATTYSGFSLDYLAFASQRYSPVVDTDSEVAGLSSGEEDEIVTHASILLKFGKMEAEWNMEDEEEEEDLPMAYHPRKKRQKTTPEQLLILEESFQTDKLPSPSARSKLAKHLGMSPRRVQIWFQNKRAKEKKTNPRGKHHWVVVPSSLSPPSPPSAGSSSPTAGVVSPMEGITDSMVNILGNDLQKPTALYPGGMTPFEFTAPSGYSCLSSTDSAFVPIPFHISLNEENSTRVPRIKSPEHEELARALQSRISQRIW